MQNKLSSILAKLLVLGTQKNKKALESTLTEKVQSSDVNIDSLSLQEAVVLIDDVTLLKGFIKKNPIDNDEVLRLSLYFGSEQILRYLGEQENLIRPNTLTYAIIYNSPVRIFRYLMEEKKLAFSTKMSKYGLLKHANIATIKYLLNRLKGEELEHFTQQCQASPISSKVFSKETVQTVKDSLCNKPAKQSETNKNETVVSNHHEVSSQL